MTFWKKIDRDAVVLCTPTIDEALKKAREIGDQYGSMRTLVTGSLHLVSGALYLLNKA